MKAGDVVLLDFPFSDLSGSKLRPAVLIAMVGQDEYIACQVTSQDWDEAATAIDDRDFVTGSLRLASKARPTKLFTASRRIIERRVGRLKTESLERIRHAIVAVIKG